MSETCSYGALFLLGHRWKDVAFLDRGIALHVDGPN